MDIQDLSVPPHAQSGVAGNEPHSRANRRPDVRPSGVRPSGGRFSDDHFSGDHVSGVTHDNVRHTTRFTVIGNHLAQHGELSLLAIGLGVHIQSLPGGARVDIKTLANRFPEGASRIAAALRELEAHGYLRRVRERTPAGRIVTRTISSNQPTSHRHRTNTPARVQHPQATPAPPAPLAPQAPAVPPAPPAPPVDDTAPATRTPILTTHDPAPAAHAPTTAAHDTGLDGSQAARRERPAPSKRRPLPAVPSPAFPSDALLRTASDLLTDLRGHDHRLLFSVCETDHLATGVAAWLERGVPVAAVRHALIADLPPEGPRRPAALLAHRLVAQLPPVPPFRAPAPPPVVRHPLQNCEDCDRAFRAPEPGVCGDCRPAARAAAPAPAQELPR
jgi:hypothetical protein